VRDTVIACVRLPLVPVMCTVYVPVGELRLVDMVNVTLVPFVGFGLMVAVALLGDPVTANWTDPANPSSRVIVTV